MSQNAEISRATNLREANLTTHRLNVNYHCDYSELTSIFSERNYSICFAFPREFLPRDELEVSRRKSCKYESRHEDLIKRFLSFLCLLSQSAFGKSFCFLFSSMESASLQDSFKKKRDGRGLACFWSHPASGFVA